MPSRWICLLIVVFWLATSGWLFYHDVFPYLLPGQPPPYMIDLVEEAQLRRPFIDWAVFHNNQRVLRARTRVESLAHDSYELQADYTSVPGHPATIHNILITEMSSRYRVNSAGDLLGLTVTVKGAPQLGELLRFLSADFDLRIEGTARGNTFQPRAQLLLPNGKERTFTLPDVPVSRGGSVLLPLHPVNRLRGLVPGQRWTMAVFDPLADSLGSLQGTASGPRWLYARVRAELETFSWQRRQAARCLVVDYRGDDFQATTHVESERGLVLAQSVTLGKDDHWTMYRE